MRVLALIAFAILISAGAAHAQNGYLVTPFGNVPRIAPAPNTMTMPNPLAGQAGQQGWESANNIGQQPTGDPTLLRCFYQTINGYRFSINARNVCPSPVSVNPVTNQVRH